MKSPKTTGSITDATLLRAVKLTGVALAISIGLCGLGFFLPEIYRWLLWAVAGGLLVSMLLFAEGARRRASMPAPVATADRAKKNKQTAIWATATAIVASVLAAFTRHLLGDAAGMVLLGAAFGVLAAFALILGPLFYKPAPLIFVYFPAANLLQSSACTRTISLQALPPGLNTEASR